MKPAKAHLIFLIACIYKSYKSKGVALGLRTLTYKINRNQDRYATRFKKLELFVQTLDSCPVVFELLDPAFVGLLDQQSSSGLMLVKNTNIGKFLKT